MQSSAWALVFRQFPPEQHNNLMLSIGGIEIAVQDLLRIDHEHVAIRGRLAGSQDAGRLFIIPYQSINYLGSHRPCKESDYQELFDKVEFPAPTTVPEPAEEATVATPPAAPAEPETTPAASSAKVSPSSKTPVPIRSTVLERFRARTSSGSSIVLPPPGASSLDLPRPREE
jgi:hypothetical protein